jgi:ADP-heptose:LPS heptosyltransferase
MSNEKIQAGLAHLAVALKAPTVAIYTDMSQA